MHEIIIILKTDKIKRQEIYLLEKKLGKTIAMTKWNNIYLILIIGRLGGARSLDWKPSEKKEGLGGIKFKLLAHLSSCSKLNGVGWNL